jgi:hypothetical protein
MLSKPEISGKERLLENEGEKQKLQHTVYNVFISKSTNFMQKCSHNLQRVSFANSGSIFIRYVGIRFAVAGHVRLLLQIK